jgi:cobalt transporter subunit CbtB
MVLICGGQTLAGVFARAHTRQLSPPRSAQFQCSTGGLTMSTQSIATTTATFSARLIPGLSALLLGTAVIFLVGFAPMAAMHNAAHDTRHSAAFPCH